MDTVQWSLVDKGVSTSLFGMNSGIFETNWSRILYDISVILAGPFMCKVNALTSANDNFLALAVPGSALKSPISIIALTYPK